MSSAHDPAFPTPLPPGHYSTGPQTDGLTKREMIAAMAMQGFCAWDHNKGRMICDYTGRAKEAVRAADALIAELSDIGSLK